MQKNISFFNTRIITTGFFSHGQIAMVPEEEVTEVIKFHYNRKT